jgi:hypothetical protein
MIVKLRMAGCDFFVEDTKSEKSRPIWKADCSEKIQMIGNAATDQDRGAASNQKKTARLARRLEGFPLHSRPSSNGGSFFSVGWQPGRSDRSARLSGDHSYR